MADKKIVLVGAGSVPAPNLENELESLEKALLGAKELQCFPAWSGGCIFEAIVTGVRPANGGFIVKATVVPFPSTLTIKKEGQRPEWIKKGVSILVDFPHLSVSKCEGTNQAQ